MEPLERRLAPVGGVIKTAALLMAVLPLAGCSHGSDSSKPAKSPSKQPTAAAVMKVPDEDQSLRTLRLVPTRTGQMEFDINAKKGALMVGITCLGTGDITVKVHPIGAFPMHCETGKVNESLNQIDLKRPHQLTLTATGSAEVSWALRIQQ